ncbi:MAG: response regulator [Deltaproteobacteria bacterium]|nr:response regulator [Deltaproteobacteria bacterium]
MRKRILIAEDFETLSKLIRNSLRSLDADFIEASDGQEAISKAGSEHPDLIIMDVGMPKINGYDATRAIKSSPETRHIPVLILTATGDQKEAQRAGADDFLAKPYSPSDLKARVSKLMGLS